MTLAEIINYYLNSSRFNGLPIYDIDDYDMEVMSGLIKEGLVKAISRILILRDLS